jgi:hypothetical protein
MLVDIASYVVSSIGDIWKYQHLGFLSRPLVICLFVFLLLLVWRIWTFTIRPYFHPEDPRELPYWIPSKSSLTLTGGG